MMHPVTLGALGTLLVNDYLFKHIWPGAWIPGKLSDLAWMIFAPPVLAYILSFAAQKSPQGQRAALVAAYAGLPLLYASFNTFQLVHDAILRALGSIGGDGPRSPLDSTDSLVIPVAMAAALWVWRRPPLEAHSIRTRLALMAATAASLATVATTYDYDLGVTQVDRTTSGTLRANTSLGSYESMDNGLTWTKTSEDFLRMGPQERRELAMRTPTGAIFVVDDPYIIRRDETSSYEEVVYNYSYLQSGGNRWMQALDKRNILGSVITTGALDLFYDDQSGNLFVAMGLQGVVIVAPDGTYKRVAVGHYSPTDFSFGNKVRTLFSSLLLRKNAEFTGRSLLLTFTLAALALAAPAAPAWPRILFVLAAATSTFLAVSLGVYPYALEAPWEESQLDIRIMGEAALLIPGFGLLPLLMSVGGLVLARTSLRKALAVAAASIGMLPLIGVGALVLFEAGTLIANFVAVGLVGLAAVGLWVYQNRTRGV